MRMPLHSTHQKRATMRMPLHSTHQKRATMCLPLHSTHQKRATMRMPLHSTHQKRATMRMPLTLAYQKRATIIPVIPPHISTLLAWRAGTRPRFRRGHRCRQLGCCQGARRDGEGSGIQTMGSEPWRDETRILGDRYRSLRAYQCRSLRTLWIAADRCRSLRTLADRCGSLLIPRTSARSRSTQADETHLGGIPLHSG
jgi:hypothetical protein